MDQKGFTLIEILISLAITAVITSLLYGTFRTTLKTTQMIDHNTEVHRMARAVFHQLDKDIRMIYQKNVTEPNPSGETPFGATPVKGKDDVRFVEGGIYPADTLQFTSLSYQPVRKGTPFSGQAEITYSLQDDRLVRQANFREKKVEHDLSESVLGLNFQYFDNKEKKWIDEWNTNPDGPPNAIAVELILKSPSPQTSTSIPSERSTSEYRFKTIITLGRITS